MKNLDLDRAESDKAFDAQFKRDSMPTNRDIKFRCWGIESETMYEPAFPSWNGSIEVWKENKPQTETEWLSIGGPEMLGILMQYTGLKDKNGVEIYEGDLVIARKANCSLDGKFNDIHKVEYSAHFAQFVLVCFKSDNKYRVGRIAEKRNNQPFLLNNVNEIIGNIYETPLTNI